jgi:hypothetical protein
MPLIGPLNSGGLKVGWEMSIYVKKSSDSSYFYEWLPYVCIIIRAKFH